MQYKVSAPETVSPYTVNLPTSKSISNRALILNALAYSAKPIKNLSDSDDTQLLIKALQSDGSKFDVGAAGTTMRFLTAFLSKIVGEWTITGSERMKQRPIKILVEALNKLGAKIEYVEKEGYPPLKIFGSAMEGGDLELAGDVSSQYISALLMIGPTMKSGLRLTLTGEIISRPYILLTLKMMETFGVKSHWKDNVITVPEGQYQPTDFTVEADWSAASYWFQVAALNKGTELILKGVKRYSEQGDSKVAELFTQLGVDFKFSKNGLVLKNTGKIANQFNYNFIEQPDLAQTFAVTCCCLGVPFKFTGLQTLKIKETDRINALIDELKKMGFVLTSNQVDDLVWDGTTCDKEDVPCIATYKDHRMAMAFAPAVSVISNMAIDDPAVVSKSYPKYWDHIKEFGYSVQE
ncbi:3-phosphoshikimate 1-carboxyvinyltransferase [Plebeiibacterium sediminum]|uniref:3-phosphoshikimate 1-carboxyvinyltransferase n=1 Tax=Plebeiibacterium sediminum TaxID=2992112 RepID=A0AAE3M5F0_9BACT|nr:3-phosphoshikimate 1-carboxyvinyltransferase [Plebeiobacterium sediminum]MCW3787182.1 3-phosphoshikimate 1-carboxyvinyltransferase [Plebeiobacterium sediminum]